MPLCRAETKPSYYFGTWSRKNNTAKVIILFKHHRRTTYSQEETKLNTRLCGQGQSTQVASVLEVLLSIPSPGDLEVTKWGSGLAKVDTVRMGSSY